MKRIFTRTFFHFLVAFVVILGLSFTVVVITAYQSPIDRPVDSSTNQQ